MDDSSLMTSRTDDSSGIELRGRCPREIVDVLDAISSVRYMDRMALVIEVLREWDRGRVHEATVLARVTRINPQPRMPSE